MARRPHAQIRTTRRLRRVSARTRIKARQRETRERALRALRRMRKGASLSAASRAEHTKPATVRRHVGRAVRRDTPGGRFRAAPTDRLVRLLQVRAEDGELVRVPARSLAVARFLSQYENAVAHFLRTGDASRLLVFRGKRVTTEDGRRIELLTDAERLQTLAAADLVHLDSLYAAPTSKPLR